MSEAIGLKVSEGVSPLCYGVGCPKHQECRRYLEMDNWLDTGGALVEWVATCMMRTADDHLGWPTYSYPKFLPIKPA